MSQIGMRNIRPYPQAAPAHSPALIAMRRINKPPPTHATADQMMAAPLADESSRLSALGLSLLVIGA
jgi:hypothetical protein